MPKVTQVSRPRPWDRRDHVGHPVQVFVRGVAPGRAHALRRALAAAAARTLVSDTSRSVSQISAMASALGTVAAILGTGPSLDAEQGAEWTLFG